MAPTRWIVAERLWPSSSKMLPATLARSIRVRASVKTTTTSGRFPGAKCACSRAGTDSKASVRPEGPTTPCDKSGLDWAGRKIPQYLFDQAHNRQGSRALRFVVDGDVDGLRELERF